MITKTHKIEIEGSVRVDLVGGTLDLEPLALIIKDTVTINMATNLKARVTLEKKDSDDLVIHSLDYGKTYTYSINNFSEDNFYKDGVMSSHFFKEMLFVVLISKHFKCTKGFYITLSSGAPAGSGLGGSSAMGVTLAKAFLTYLGRRESEHSIVSQVRKIEEVILHRGVAGYQDYYPALYGGILAIHPDILNHRIEQCYTDDLALFLSQNITLVYSGLSRNSGINNWEVFKTFFDNPKEQGLIQIAQVAKNAYKNLKEKKFHNFLIDIAHEGALREKLFSGIMTTEMKELDLACQKLFPGEYKGIKVCGAGGGGCFLLVGVSPKKVQNLVEKNKMKILPLEVSSPLEGHSSF